MQYHEPVLLNEVIENLKIKAGGKYIDCTLGDGGHALEILELGGSVLGLDYNSESLGRAQKRIFDAGFGKEFTGILGNFKDIENLAKVHGYLQVDGILYDLGYSSSQLNEEAGLSFLQDQPLDMRLDKNLGVTAADLVNSLNEKQLADIFYNYSDERMSRRFASAIVRRRNLKKFQTTKELADLLAGEVSPGYENGRIHPATRVFQALRIAVNDEIDNLKYSLPRAAQILLPGGRMMVITFHSLEDKVVKDFGRYVQPTLSVVNKKPIIPSEAEIARNNRARSAKLRIFERV